MEFTLAHIPLMRAAATLNDIPSFERMRDARSLSADMLAERLRKSALTAKILKQRCRFVMRVATATFCDIFLSGPGAVDDRRTYIKTHKRVTDQLVSDLLDVAILYLAVPFRKIA